MQKDISIQLLNLKDADIEITGLKIIGNIKEIHIKKTDREVYCPICSFRMYSKGPYRRKVNHPVMQDGYQIRLVVSQRRYECTNPDCRFSCKESFSFLQPYKRTSNVTDHMIVLAFKEHRLTARQIAERYHVSDTHAIHTFLRYVDMPRRQLTKAICIDEVDVNIYHNCKYALVIQDFISGEPVDILPSRRNEWTENYFTSIPARERAQVKYLVTDMYAPYAAYIDKYFPHAIHAVDSFHVIKWLNSKIKKYMTGLVRKQKAKDEKLHQDREQEFGRHLDFTPSREYYILKKYQWLVLSNTDNLDYRKAPYYNKRLHRYVDTYTLENMLFEIAPELREIRDMKEEYIRFNKSCAGNSTAARKGLDEIIDMYDHSEYWIFRETAQTLRKYFEQIINSFILVERYHSGEKTPARLSNGPMEALNNIPKDMKRLGRGYRNWEYFRNRFLFSQRENAAILATPKPLNEVCFKTGRKRAPYRKKKPARKKRKILRIVEKKH